MTTRKNMGIVQKQPPAAPAATPLGPGAPPDTLSDADYAEIRSVGGELQEARATHQRAVAGLADAEAVWNYLMRRLARVYGLVEGDRVEDDGAISRVPAPTAVGQ